MMINKTNNRTIIISSVILFFFILYFIVKIQIKSKESKSILFNQNKELIAVVKSIKNGKRLYEKNNCIDCHKVNKLQQPNLVKDLLDKYEKGYLIGFIQNEDSLIKIKNPQALSINNEFKNNWNHKYDLSKEM